MKTTINRRIFNTAIWDSAALGPMAFVLHRFREPGLYQAVAKKDRVPVGQFLFRVSAESDSPQIHIDLSEAPSPKKAVVSGLEGDIPTVSPEGFVLFQATRGSGYSVIAGMRTTRAGQAFNSEKLGEGDYFAVTLIQPGQYVATNKVGGGKSAVTVVFGEEHRGKLGQLETLHVVAGKDGITPSEFKIVATQGLVFDLTGPARIVIEPKRARQEKNTEKRRMRVSAV